VCLDEAARGIIYVFMNSHLDTLQNTQPSNPDEGYQTMASVTLHHHFATMQTARIFEYAPLAGLRSIGTLVAMRNV
jgi:hypothetical protein